MPMWAILLIILLLIGGGGSWYAPDYRVQWGGGIGLVLIVLLILLAMGRL